MCAGLRVLRSQASHLARRQQSNAPPALHPFPGIPLLAAYKGEAFSSFVDLQPCASHEAALDETRQFLDAQLRTPANPFRCPWVKCATAPAAARLPCRCCAVQARLG